MGDFMALYHTEVSVLFRLHSQISQSFPIWIWQPYPPKLAVSQEDLTALPHLYRSFQFYELPLTAPASLAMERGMLNIFSILYLAAYISAHGSDSFALISCFFSALVLLMTF